jgi:hypothetical protein
VVKEPQPPSTKPCKTSHPSSLPNANENEAPHAEKNPKKERFSPLFSIFGGAIENGEKWRKSIVFRRFLSVWCFFFIPTWKGGRVRGCESNECFLKEKFHHLAMNVGKMVFFSE